MKNKKTPYATLVGEMAKKHITAQQIAELLGAHRNTISNKLAGESDFTIPEAFKIRDFFFAAESVDKLFTKDST